MDLRKSILLIVVAFFVVLAANSQSVGLVLSGGGGPGIAHIGVIKALEENNIPIDYITGTSIGAIVGGLYSAGFSPDEMIGIFKSKEFKALSTGEIATKNRYSYYQNYFNPGLISVDLAKSSIHLSTNVISPHAMNYQFFLMFDQASAICKNNFDSLFVPFRCVASDIYERKSVVFDKGDLSVAIRSSMSFPFIFKSTGQYDKLLYDGGIYNNFPVDVLEKEFNPDYCIGSVVAYNPPKAGKNDPLMQLQNMIIAPTEYSLKGRNGILFDFDLKSYGTWDFSKVDELVQIGYDSVMKHIDEIKQAIKREKPIAEVSSERLNFKTGIPKMNYDSLLISGLKSSKSRYKLLQNVGQIKDENFRRTYFQLAASGRVEQMIPETFLDTLNGAVKLKLRLDAHEPMNLSLGGNFSTNGANQLYAGISYHDMARWAKKLVLDGQMGTFYNGLGFYSRLEFPASFPANLKLNAIWHNFNYSGSRDNWLQRWYDQDEVYGDLSFGVGIEAKSTVEAGIGLGKINYNYNSEDANSNYREDESTFNLKKAFVRIFDNSLNNNRIYPTNGYSYFVSAQLFDGTEADLIQNQFHRTILNSWIQLKAFGEVYATISDRINLGFSAEMGYSTAKPFSNYSISEIQQLSFRPTLLSKTVYNSAYASNQFVGLGIKPIYKLTDQFHLRVDTYCFLPFQKLNSSNVFYRLNKPFDYMGIVSEAAFVFRLNSFTASLFGNYFSNSNKQWYVGVSIGIPVFRTKFMD